MYDYGWELPDIRETWVLNDESSISLRIRRDWFYDSEMDEDDYTVSWDILKDGKVFMSLPNNTSECKARKIILALFEDDIDENSTQDVREADRINAMEIRFGA